MKSLKGILLLISFVVASAAHAKAACTIYVAADPSQPNNQEKVIFTGPVTPSPSSNEEDKRRMSYVIVKRDLSATTVITHDELDRRDQRSDWKDFDGDTLVSYQETVTRGVYGVFATAIDANLKMSEMNQEAFGFAAAPFALGVPSRNFSIVCDKVKTKRGKK